MLISIVVEVDALMESVTLMVKFAIPAVVGVPEIKPLRLRFSPAGSDPSPGGTDHVRVPVPPVAASCCEYTVPTVPPGRVVVVIVSAAAIVMENCFDATALAASVT